MKHTQGNEAFSLLEVLVVLALISMLILGFGNSMIKNLQARKVVEGKLGYQEVSTSTRSLLSQLVKTPPPSGCLGFSSLQQATQDSSLLAFDKQIAAGLAPRSQEILQQPRNEFARSAVERCSHPRDINTPSNANDNTVYLCSRFKNQGVGSESAVLNSPHAFAEYKLEFINSQTNLPISCDEYRNSKQAGVNVYYSFYWLDGKAAASTYSKYIGYFYVGK